MTRRLKNYWLVLPLFSGVGGLFGGLGTHLLSHSDWVVTVGTCVGAVIASISTAVVAIVRIRTDQAPENRRTAALTHIADKHYDPDRAMRLLILDRYVSKAQGPNADKVMDVLGSEPTPRGAHADSPDVMELVKRSDAGDDVVPPHPPEVDGRSGNCPDLSGLPST